MFKIYGLHTPMFLKVVLGAAEIGAPYEVIPVDLKKGETRLPEHRARHPFGKVPVLEHNGTTVFESNAILRYMGNVTETSLYPKAPAARAQVDQWLDYFSLQAGRWCTAVWFQKVIVKDVFNEEPDEKLIADSSEALLEVMPTIDAHLKTNAWLCGKDFTIADVNAYALMMGHKKTGLNFGDFPAFNAWFAKIESRPSLKALAQYQ